MLPARGSPTVVAETTNGSEPSDGKCRVYVVEVVLVVEEVVLVVEEVVLVVEEVVLVVVEVVLVVVEVVLVVVEVVLVVVEVVLDVEEEPKFVDSPVEKNSVHCQYVQARIGFKLRVRPPFRTVMKFKPSL